MSINLKIDIIFIWYTFKLVEVLCAFFYIVQIRMYKVKYSSVGFHFVMNSHYLYVPGSFDIQIIYKIRVSARLWNLQDNSQFYQNFFRTFFNNCSNFIKFFRTIWEIGGQMSWDRFLTESLEILYFKWINLHFINSVNNIFFPSNYNLMHVQWNLSKPKPEYNILLYKPNFK